MKKYLKCQASVHEEERENTLWKWIFVNRIKNRYVDSLMNKKYLFMAVKFRAIKVKMLTYSDLSKNIRRLEDQ
jgi:hypothetical protein